MALIPREQAIDEALEYYKGAILCTLQSITYARKHNDQEYLRHCKTRLDNYRKHQQAVKDMRSLGCTKEMAWKLNGLCIN